MKNLIILIFAFLPGLALAQSAHDNHGGAQDGHGAQGVGHGAAGSMECKMDKDAEDGEKACKMGEDMANAHGAAAGDTHGGDHANHEDHAAVHAAHHGADAAHGAGQANPH